MRSIILIVIIIIIITVVPPSEIVSRCSRPRKKSWAKTRGVGGYPFIYCHVTGLDHMKGMT